MRTALTSLAALATLALLAGCSGGAKTAKEDPIQPPKTREELLKDAAEKMNERPKDHYTIKEPGDGWDGAQGSLIDLGRRMDEKARATKNALCEGKLTYDDPSIGALTGSPQIRIQDARTFEIEYMLPETKSAFNRIKGDGSKRAVLEGKGWVQLTAFSKSPKALSEKEVLEFPRRFPVDMFAHYTKSADVWAPLFEAWNKGVGGYKAVFEEQKFRKGDKTAAHYRVYAKTTEGSPTTIEVIVDKQHLRPLTIKVEGTNEDGEKYNMFWTGQWKTGGTYDEGVFSIPQPAPRTAKAS